MPELPEVETVRQGLQNACLQHRFTQVDVRRFDLRFPIPLQMARLVEGQKIQAIQRRAKFLQIILENNQVLVVHLGMSGRILIDQGALNEDLARHDHVVFITDRACRVRYRDPRRFGFISLISQSELTQHPFFAHLGPEPLDPTFTADVLAYQLRGKKTPIKSALLDQRVVAGLGNIYVCEALFQAGLSPFRSAASLTLPECSRLLEALREILTKAIAAGGSTLRDHRQPQGDIGYFQHSFKVYNQENMLCSRCQREDLVIQRHRQAGRSTFFCPQCQL